MDENLTIDHDRILKINIEEEMKSSYIDYSMSVIVARAGMVSNLYTVVSYTVCSVLETQVINHTRNVPAL